MDLPDEIDKLDLDNEEMLSEDLLLNMLDEIQNKELDKPQEPFYPDPKFIKVVAKLFHDTEWNDLRPLSIERPAACFVCCESQCAHTEQRESRISIDELLDGISLDTCLHKNSQKILTDICLDCLSDTFAKIPIQKTDPIMILWDAEDLIQYTNWIQNIDDGSFLHN